MREQVNSLVAWRNTIMGGVAVVVVLLGVGVYDGNKVSNSIDEILDAQAEATLEFKVYQATARPMLAPEMKAWTMQRLDVLDARIKENKKAIKDGCE